MPELTPEQRVRKNIEKMLEEAGWVVQDLKQLNLGVALGVAVREFREESPHKNRKRQVELKSG